MEIYMGLLVALLNFVPALSLLLHKNHHVVVMFDRTKLAQLSINSLDRVEQTSSIAGTGRTD